MKQEQDNYCYLFTLASANKATLATLKTLHTTFITQLIYFTYCIWTCKMIMTCLGIVWTAFLLASLKLHCCCCIVKIHITCIVIVVFYISLKLTNCEYCSKHDPEEVKPSSNWRPVIKQLSISYVPVRSEDRAPVCHPPSPSTAWTNDCPINPRE